MSVQGMQIPRGNYLIQGGAVVTVDPALGTFPGANVLVRDGAIAAVAPELAADGAEVIDASHMIVMPGLIDFALSHVEHNWPQLHFRRWFRVFSGEVGDVGAIRRGGFLQ